MSYEFENARRSRAEDTGDVALSKLINHVFGNTETLISRPSNTVSLFLQVESDADSFRLKPGDYRARDFADGDVTTATNVAVVDNLSGAHEFEAGDGPYRLSTSGALPTGLSDSVDYYIEVVNSTTIAFHLSREAAIAADSTTRVNITAAGGGGTHTIGGVAGAASATITNGTGSFQVSTPSGQTPRIHAFTAPSRLTVVGNDASAILTYWWV